jgi:hypothetical protein
MTRKGRSAVALVLMVGLAGAPWAWAGDGVVALQTADPSCSDDSGKIYVDCDNGTVTDNRSGLVWLANANCLGLDDPVDGSNDGGAAWSLAMEFVASLGDIPAGSAAAADDCGLSDGSSPGEWRLPTVAEWEAMIEDAVLLGCVGAFAPSITNDTGDSCWQEGPGSSFTGVAGVAAGFYWSSSIAVSENTGSSQQTLAWAARLHEGDVSRNSRSAQNLTWPVRGGQ